MKKITTLLAAAALATTLSANAQDVLYFTGEWNGWTPSNPQEVTLSASDQYFEIDLMDCAKFKMSTAKGDWDTFNSNALSVQGGMISDEGTFPLVNWGENSVLPWKGDWTVRVSPDLSTITVQTNTPKPTTFADVYIRGVMNSWGAPDSWKFSTTDGNVYTLSNVTISAGQNFKIGDAGWDKVNYGGVTGMAESTYYTLNYNGSDCNLAADFTGDVTFILDSRTILFGAKPVPENLYLTGEPFGGWDVVNPDYKMTKLSDSSYTITLPEGLSGQWKIWDGTWNYTFGPTGDLVAGENNVLFNQPGNYQFAEGSDLTGKPVVITLTIPENADLPSSGVYAILDLDFSDQTGISAIETAGAEAEYYNLQGVRVANPERGIYIVRCGDKVMKVVK